MPPSDPARDPKPETAVSGNPDHAAKAARDAECIRRILLEKQLFHELIRPCERAIYLMLLGILGQLGRGGGCRTGDRDQGLPGT